MLNQDRSLDREKSTKYNTKSEVDRVFSVFERFNKEAEATKSSLEEDTVSDRAPVLTMSSLGQSGRFGNQIFQYAFLRLCAQKSGARVECPPWIGQTLFGHQDDPISKLLPPAIERPEKGETFFDLIPELIPYLETLAEARSSRIGVEAIEQGLADVDLWGQFQVHTRFLKPHQKSLLTLFQPVRELKSALEEGLSQLRSKGQTLVGIHLRRGDFLKAPAVGSLLVVPTKWYCEWLDRIWDELEAPVLFLCSDDLDSVIHDFDKFCPVTSRDLDIKLPERMKELNLEFYIDFFLLSNCDVVGISNSTFSFAACLLNEHGRMFVRPHWDFSTKFTVFDPWNSEPMLWLGGENPKLFKSFVDILYVTYVTQGIVGMLRSACIYFPKERITFWAIRAYLVYKTKDIFGIIRSFRARLLACFSH